MTSNFDTPSLFGLLLNTGLRFISKRAKNSILAASATSMVAKGLPLDKVTQEQVMDIQNRLNQRPRKLLGFRTPEEVYTEMTLAA